MVDKTLPRSLSFGPPQAVAHGRRWLRFKLRHLMLLVAVIAVGLTLAVRFGPHIAWRFGGGHSLARSWVKAIPTSAMPDAQVPEGWVAVQVGSLKLLLPPNLAATAKMADESAAIKWMEFGDEPPSLYVQMPQDNEETNRAWQSLVAQLPRRVDEQYSLARLITEIYRAGADDFHWLMSPDELKLHRWRMAMASLYGSGNAMAVETVSLSTIEALLIWTERNSPRAEWFSSDGNTAGTILFDKNLDRDWIRTVCQSLEFCNDASE